MHDNILPKFEDIDVVIIIYLGLIASSREVEKEIEVLVRYDFKNIFHIKT